MPCPTRQPFMGSVKWPVNTGAVTTMNSTTNQSRGFAFADLQIQDLEMIQRQIFNNKAICVAPAVEKDKYQRPDVQLDKKKIKRIRQSTIAQIIDGTIWLTMAWKAVLNKVKN